MIARPTILVACDEPSERAWLAAELDREFRVITHDSASGAAAVATLDPEAALCDLDTLNRIRAVSMDLPAVVYLVNPTPEQAVSAIHAGHVYGLIAKGDADGLLGAVRRAVETRSVRREQAQEIERLKRRLDATTVVAELAAAAGDLSSERDILDVVTASLHRIVRFDVAAAVVTEGLPWQALAHLHCQTPCDDGTLAAARDRALELHAALTGSALTEDHLVTRVTGDRLAGARPPRATSATHVPLVGDGRILGVLYLVAFRPRAFTAEDERLLYLVAAQTAQALYRLTSRIHDERRRMSLMVESMADGVIMTDDKGEVFLINPAARRMLGLGHDLTVTAKYLKERLGFYPFDLVTRAHPAREEVTVDGKTLGSIVSPVLGEGETLVGTVVVLRDITEWKQLEQRKEEFVSIVSHELRTPLTSITGALDIVMKDYAGGLSDRQRRYLQVARDSCTRLHAIVNDLLDVARFERGKMPMEWNPLSLDRLAQECVERFRAAADAKQIALQVKRGEREVRIVGDADRLAQVMNNLLSNAIKFTPDDGRVEVEVFGPDVVEAHVGVSVWNNGDAIPEADRERVFDKFEQVHASATRRVGGTGLGLAISRSIVEGHGGKIWVEHAPVGTKFVFTLPEAPAPAAVDLALPADEGPPSGKQVLVVDDDRNAAYLLKGVLMTAGHRVHVAHDADEALTIARDKRPELVTVDVRLPGVDGLALVEILKHDPDTRKAGVVVVSGAVDREAALLAGADAFFGKPVDIDPFREACARILQEKARAGATKILVVDDDAGIRMICRDVLENAGFVVREASSGPHALAEAKRFRPDLMLLDVMMPELDGFQTAKRFRAERDGTMTPVIFVSARGQTADKVRAFKLGAEDYLVKPFDSAELVARVEKALARRERELGASPTTKLPGAGAIEAEIERRLAAGAEFAFCYVDLDNLKAFNDYYGIAKADGVIRQTGDLMREVVAREGRGGDFIGHIAGDDFVFVTVPDRVDRIAETICRTFDRLVPLYYNKIDRERGFIETADRYGELRRFPIMSVSLAALTTRPGERVFGNFAELAAAAAEAKKLAKSVEGTAYVRDGTIVRPARLSSATVA